MEQKKITISQEQALRMIINDFFHSNVKAKEMFIVSTNNVYDEAISNIIDGKKYIIKHMKDKGCFRLALIMYTPEGEKFRQVECTYMDIFQDIVVKHAPNSVAIADRMWNALSNMPDDIWEKASDEYAKNEQKKTGIII